MYAFNPWSRVLLEKITGFQLVKELYAFYGTRKFLPHSQEPVTSPYHEPDQSSPCPLIPLAEDTFKYYPRIYA